ncbi:hypothetical protein PUN28_009418 [Cardiocondyla obscurior]|uniref:Uncharacterized protein n=1 Tax=Cardiocondyla obscurior TaxID=286306 RepID=A0AAW2FUB2_9HYME
MKPRTYTIDLCETSCIRRWRGTASAVGLGNQLAERGACAIRDAHLAIVLLETTISQEYNKQPYTRVQCTYIRSNPLTDRVCFTDRCERLVAIAARRFSPRDQVRRNEIKTGNAAVEFARNFISQNQGPFA